MLEQQVLYRVECRNYDEVFNPKIEYVEYKIISETKCGYWIHKHRNYGPKKFVLKNEHQAGKRFAYTTKESALNAFVFRRLRMRDILNSQTKRNNKTLDFAYELIANNDYNNRSLNEYEKEDHIDF